MDAALEKVNIALQEAVDALQGALKEARLTTLLTTDSLPDKQTWQVASQTVDLADTLVRLLQPPSVQLAESYLAYLNTKCLCTVVTHEIADVLATAGSPLTTEELARRSGVQPQRLKQVMRVLRNNGIFEHDAGTDTYANNATSTLLTKTHWTQWHRWVDLYGNEFYEAARAMPASVRLGETRSAAQITYGTEVDIFRYFASADRSLQERFHATLGAGAVAQAPGILTDYDWGQLEDVVLLDIGGGGGDFIAALLRGHPEMRGALLDLDSVIDMVTPKFRDPGGPFADVSGRMVGLHGGDFFDKVPSYEAYTIKWCLHNWADADVVKILGVVRRAIVRTQRARLVVVEAVLGEGRSARMGRFGDLTMMATVNGGERTESEWRRLAAEAGWEVTIIAPLRNAWAAAIELRPLDV